MTYEPIPVFFIRPTNRYVESFRRYQSSTKGGCPGMPGQYSYHNASVKVGEVVHGLEGEDRYSPTCGRQRDREGDPRWPLKCDNCNYMFAADDEWQVNYDCIYVAADGREMSLRDHVPGACWDAWWMYKDGEGKVDEDRRVGPDGRNLVVVLPNGREWMIDMRASNCTQPSDHDHRCWVRHGRPEDGTLHIDKQGLTCEAGAGSIISGDYHGFLHNGWFTRG